MNAQPDAGTLLTRALDQMAGLLGSVTTRQATSEPVPTHSSST